LFPLTPALSLGERENVRVRFEFVVGVGRFAFRLGICAHADAGRNVGVTEELGGVILEEPVTEATLFPFGEVLFGDGSVVEVGGEDGFDFRERVEPRENGFVRLVIVETKVELVAELMRKTSDFADTSCSVHMILILVFGKSVGRGVGHLLSYRKSTEALGKLNELDTLNKLNGWKKS
jgi:hypothetical protein